MDKLNNKNVMAIRYEDISLHQRTISQQIYDFIGHSMPKGLKDWIKENSESDEANESDPYSTKASFETVSRKVR